MVAPLIALFARWGLPESVRRPLATLTTIIAVAGLCGLLWTCWLRSHDKQVIEQHEAKVGEAVASQSASASASASAAASETKAGVEAGNDAARKAASGSADPLKAALDKLKK